MLRHARRCAALLRYCYVIALRYARRCAIADVVACAVYANSATCCFIDLILLISSAMLLLIFSYIHTMLIIAYAIGDVVAACRFVVTMAAYARGCCALYAICVAYAAITPYYC